MKVVFMGTPDFSVPTLQRLIDSDVQVVAVYTQPDKPVGRGLQMHESPVKKLALKNNIPVFTPEKISIPEEVARLKTFGADFFVVVAYGQILKPEVIEIPRFGCVNIHSSLLPRWRGAAPIQWAILGGDQESGVTTMKIVQKLDAGDMLMQSRTPIKADDTAASLHDRLSQMGADLILPTLQGVKDSTIKPKPQNETQVTYAKKLTKEMENLDWSKSALDIDRSVRALNPWPGTRISLSNGMKMRIRAGLPKMSLSCEAGNIFEDKGQLFLSCGQGSYQILTLQEEGKKAVEYTDFLNGLKGRGVALPQKILLHGAL